MADNTLLSAGSGGDTIATDDIGGVKHQRVKIEVGSDGAATDVPSVSAGLDTTGSGIPPAAILGQLDDVATAAVTENQFAPVRVSTRRALLVEGVASGTEIPVSAASLPLPTGAATLAEQQTQTTHLSNVATSAGVMDDWDEADRAKVNPIVGQAGIAAGAGAVDATVPRVTLASDDPAVTSLGVIDDWDESDRAKVNLIAGQAGITAGAGAVDASTPRVTLASDDPAVAALGGNLKVVGPIAHDSPDTGTAPVKVGGKVPVDSESTPTEVAVSDIVDAWFERDGAQVVGFREAARQDATWDTGTALNTTLDLDVSRMGAAIIWVRKTSGTITAGELAFQCSVNGGTSFVELSGSNGSRMQTGVLLTGSDYWNGGEAGWRFMVSGMDRLRVKLTTAITGTSTPTFVISMRAVAGPVVPGTIARHQFKQLAATVTGTGTSTFDLEGTTGSPCLSITGGSWSGGIDFSMSPDGTNFYPAIALNVNTYAGTEFTTTANGAWVFNACGGMRYLRVTGNTVTNTASIFWSVGTGGANVVYGVVSGDKAHDAPDSSTFPIKVGYRAIAHGSNPTAVAAADRTHGYANRHGIPFVMGGHPNIQTAEYGTTGSQTDDAVIAVVGSGTKIVVTGVTVTVSNATTVNVNCRIGFGTSGGNALPSAGASGADGVGQIFLSHPGIAPGSGVSRGDGSGIIGIGADGEDVRITCGAPTSGELRVILTYYTIES